MKSILIIDDDVKTSSKYNKWLESEGGFNSTLINDPQTAESNFKSTDYDLVLIGFKMSVMDRLNLYDKLHELSKKVEYTPKEFRVCFMTSSVINYKY
jgi:DNA-binding NtrC family response regulator